MTETNGKSKKKKGLSFLTVALGCGASVLAFIIILSLLFWLANNTLINMMNTSTVELITKLEKKGFKKYSVNGSEPSLTSPNSMKANITVDTPLQNKTIYWGNSLTINTPCDNDIAFIGLDCNVNSDIRGTLIYIGNKKLTIAEGVTIDKVYTYSGTYIKNSGKVTRGITHNLNAFFNQTASPKKKPQGNE